MATAESRESPDTVRKGYTPPKGRPTRARGALSTRGRVFGPITQWLALIALAVLIIVVILVLTDGGDFNPFDTGDDGIGAVLGGLAALQR